MFLNQGNQEYQEIKISPPKGGFKDFSLPTSGIYQCSSHKNMKEKVRLFNQLRDFLLSIKNKNEMENFLLGILTPKERDEIPMRLEIIKLIKKGIPHQEIAKKLGIGVATVTRGSMEIKKGRFKFVTGFKK